VADISASTQNGKLNWAGSASYRSGEIAPVIPFESPDNLARSLVHGDYPRGRLLDEILFRLSLEAGSDSMPRGMTIDAGQRRALEEYFLAVAARGTAHDQP
jgi:hypothetical protein